MIDLDETPSEQVSTLSRWPWAIAAVATVVAAVMVGMLIPRPAATVDGPRPTFVVTAVSNPGEVGVDLAAFIPTMTVWYGDGTREDASLALQPGGWTPDKPVRMLTVVAGVSCAIQADGRLADIERADVNRVALCVWLAP